jgi:hypothetical protein
MSTGTTDQVLERRVRELLLLQETAKKVNSILDLEKLLDEIVGGVAEAFGCNGRQCCCRITLETTWR